MQRQAKWAFLLLLLATPVLAQTTEPIKPPPAEKPPVVSKADKSYAVGVNIGRNIKGDEIEIDLNELAKGISDALSTKKLRLTDEQMGVVMESLQREIYERQLARAKAAGEKGKKEGEAFLAANKKKPGVVETKSGLQYKVIKSGKGATPKATDTVSTHYHGTFINGDVFDSSLKAEPVQFPVNRVIPGWTEALQLMKVGDKWQLFVPSDLAYGERGSDSIAPNTTLIFEVELLGIEPARGSINPRDVSPTLPPK